MKKIFYLFALVICITGFLLTGCSLINPKIEFSDITLKYGEEASLPTEVKSGFKTVTVEYSFSGNNISIENGILKALVAETTTLVKAEYGSGESQFRVTVLLGDKNDTDKPPVNDDVDNGNTDDGINDGNTDDDNTNDGNNDDGNTDNGNGDNDDGNTDNGNGDNDVENIDKGTMTIDAPESIYSNYPGKEIKVTFSKSEYASDVVFTTDNPNVVVKDGKISASGIFSNTVAVKVIAKSEHHANQEFTVNVSTYQGGINVEDAVLSYEQNIIKDENKGGIIFVGDSYFSGQLKNGKPSFWSDFYEDFSGEKAFLMGISQSQIRDLEIVSERIVYPMEPSEIVVHIGFNDVHHGSLSVQALFDRITALCEEYKDRLPEVKIYFMGVEPKKNGYTQGTEYYESSTVKAPALTNMIKAYADGKDWFTYLETMPVFVDSNGNIKQSSYLSTDLSHPTLVAYDEIREIINLAREDKNSPNNPPVNPDEPIDYGTLTLEAPKSIYANYPAKEIKSIFSNPNYAENIVYTTNNENVFVKNGKIYAKGTFAESGVDVTVTATTEHFGTKTFVVNVSTYNGGVYAESKVQYYENNIIKDENKGGTIFVGDSYFDGTPNDAGVLPFWTDFYDDYQNEEKIFLMGISSSQIDDLEVVSERLVYPMEPKEIIVHIGFNDVHHGNLTVDELYSRITALCEQYKAKLPEVKIYFIGVEPKKNGYEPKGQYYDSSTVKAPALTAKIKEYAKSKDWFTYVDTLSIFVKNGMVNKSSYLATDLSHPTLMAYDRIRAALNEARGVENYVPKVTDDVNAKYIYNTGIGGNINDLGKYYTSSDGSALINNYIIGGKLTLTSMDALEKPHIQFRFSSGFRFLLWDANQDGKFGVGYIGTGLDTKNDLTEGAVIYDAASGLTLDWDIVVDNGKAYWFINGTLMETFEAPALQYFNIGALNADVVIYNVELTVKAKNETAYNELLKTYDFSGENSGGNSSTDSVPEVTCKTLDMATSNENSFILPYSDARVLENSRYIKYNNSELTVDYIISGKLDVTQLGGNAHFQLRFNDTYRFLIWDQNSDKTYGVGWEENNTHVNETASGSLKFDFATSSNTLEWTLVMTDAEAHLFINRTLVKSYNSFAAAPLHLNIGAENFGAKVYDLDLTLKSVNSSEYAAKLASLGITY